MLVARLQLYDISVRRRLKLSIRIKSLLSLLIECLEICDFGRVVKEVWEV